MELSTATRVDLRATQAACQFALHGIVELATNPGGQPSPVWHEALIRPGAGFEMASPADIVEALYSDAALDTDISILNRLSGWLSRQSRPQRLSINIHPDSLTRGRFMRAALDALRAQRPGEHSICLELVEFGHCSDRQTMVQNANVLRRHGALIALDDFGSKLNYFDLCAAGIVDVLKVDVSVTAGIDSCRNRQAVVRGITTLADGLDAHVVAEGIETERQLSIIKDLGVSFGQGYLFNRPEIEEGI